MHFRHLIFVYNSNVHQNFETISEWGETSPDTLFSLKILENDERVVKVA